MLSYKYSLLYFSLLCFIFSSSSSSSSICFHFLLNAAIQCVVFLFTAHIPSLMTGRMSYVDIAWPIGLFSIGVESFYCYYFPYSSFLSSSPSSSPVRILIIASIYLFIGGRMGFGALLLWWKGAFRHEFPRYQYQTIVWNQYYGGENRYNKTLAQQSEIFIQCIANTIFLNLPALIITHSPSSSLSLSAIEIVAIGCWGASFLWESIADIQKQNWIVNKKLRKMNNNKDSNNKENNNNNTAVGTVCQEGLWSLCRHPNYFGEWMVWNSISLFSLYSLFQFANINNNNNYHLGDYFVVFFGLSSSLSILLSTIILGIGVMIIFYIMYGCLVHYTGAVPAEYFSVQKRPDYKAYQATTNMFFPDICRCRKNKKYP